MHSGVHAANALQRCLKSRSVAIELAAAAERAADALHGLPHLEICLPIDVGSLDVAEAAVLGGGDNDDVRGDVTVAAQHEHVARAHLAPAQRVVLQLKGGGGRALVVAKADRVAHRAGQRDDLATPVDAKICSVSCNVFEPNFQHRYRDHDAERPEARPAIHGRNVQFWEVLADDHDERHHEEPKVGDAAELLGDRLWEEGEDVVPEAHGGRGEVGG